MKLTFKKIYATLLLSLCAFLPAVGQDFHPALPTDGSLHQVDVLAEENAESVTIDFSQFIDLLTKDMGGYDVKYLHFYFVDNNRNHLEGKITVTTDNTNGISSTFDSFFYDQWTNILNLYAEDNKNRFVVSKPTGKNWSEIMLIAALTNETDGFSQSSNDVTSGPTTLKSFFEFSFKTKEEFEAAFEFPTLPEGTKLHAYDKVPNDKNEVFLDFSTTEMQKLLKESLANGKPKYLHIYFVDAQTNEPLKLSKTENFVGQNLYNNDNSLTTCSCVNGFFAYSNQSIFDPWNTKKEEMKLTVSNPTGKDWKYVKIRAVFTDDLTGFSAQDDVIISGPTNIKSYFEFTVTTEAFRHYEGIANAKGDWDTTSGHNMQYTNEYSYEKFAEKGEKINLVLPFEMGNGLEPKGYIRWYNYDTDEAIDEDLLDREDSKYGEDLKTMYGEDGKTPKGLFALNIADNQNKENVAALTFKAPNTDAWENGEGCITIACDVSRYSDGMDALTTDGTAHLIHEPTLSMRYIFKIRPAKYIADAIKNAILAQRGGTYEDNGYISICSDAVIDSKSNEYGQDNESQVSLRLRLQDVKDYYFYSYSGHKKNNPDPKKETFGTSLLHATKIEWRVFNQAGTHYRVITDVSDDGRMCKISPQKINNANGGSWQKTEDTETNYTAQFRVGNMAYVIAYLTDGQNYCPVARFSCMFHANTAPMTADNISEERTVNYLKKYYDEVAVLSFDNHDPTSNLDLPTGPLDNMTGRPISWGMRYYGYVYKDLYNKMISSYHSLGGLSPIHGEYGLYKSFNVSDVSVDGAGGYKFSWWNNGGVFHDRTYAIEGGKQSGFFLYIDASDEPRQIASVAFDGELCAGSTMVISAAVADLTTQSTKPQLMFKLYGVVEEGGKVKERKLIHTVASGDFNYFKKNKPESGQWYQVFCRTSIQRGTDVEKYKRFHVVIDNYCENTQGADYAIDDIRIFTRNAKAEVVQKSIPCGEDNKAYFKIRILQSALINWLGSTENWINWIGQDGNYGYKYFYYQVRDKDGNPVAAEKVKYKIINAEDRNQDTKSNAEQNWGRSRVVRVYSNKPEGVDDDLYETVGSDLYAVMEDNILLEIPKEGDEYYVSLAAPTYGSGGGGDEERNKQLEGPDETTWGHPKDICSAYSEYFTIRKQELSITNADGKIVPGLIRACTDESQESYTLKAALQVPDPVNGGTTTVEDLEYTWYVVDKEGIQIGNDAIATKAKIDYTIESEHICDGYIYFKLVPSAKSVDFTDGTGKKVSIAICTDPITAKLRVLSGGPKLILGFPEVTSYPSSSDMRVVRLGLEQIGKIKDGTSLKIPVHGYGDETDKEMENFNLTYSDTSKKLIVSNTNDPMWTTSNVEIGEVTGLSKDGLLVSITKGDFHEGYEYEVHFQVYEDDNSNCLGDVYFLMKIVPEYVTWTGREDNGNSTNWNNDGNWRRSNKEELYKNDHQNYGEGDLLSLSQEENYVPMKFTKVTIPANIQAPYLTVLSAGTSDGIIDTNLSPNEASYHATEDIAYDLMVKVELTNGVYDCEKFYGNTCKEIYFKPQAELRHQENLTYDKAWVEYELVPNKWYTLTSPLKDVYAGDMYVPTSGRQETEAFEKIEFKGDDYSRTKYPIYQRSWDRTEAKVIANKDYHGDSYDATIDYTSWGGTSANDEASVISSQWSHAYNDVTVPYTPGGDNQNGFSLRANKVDSETHALIRIPKDDKSYTYYNYNDKEEDGKTGTVNKGTGQNLLMDKDTQEDGKVTMALDNYSSDNGLYLVSNPYMASIDMGAFFRTNTNVQKKYWIILRGTAYALPIDASDAENTTVDPTQAFFVMKATGSTVNEVTFTPDMMTNKKVNVENLVVSKLAKHTEAKAALAATRSAVMNASYGDKKSSVTVLLKDEADEAFVENEDVETLYDSNLADVPTLYTIAGDQAVSVNVLPEVRVMPVGIVCSEDVTATLQLTRNNTGADLYLFDRATGKTTLLTDSTDVTMQANDHGRYFLTRGVVTKIESLQDESGVKCYSPAPGLLTVTCLSSGDVIETIDLYTIDGKKLQSVRNVDNVTTTLHTYKGIKVAVVKHTGNDQAEAVKVAVR